MWYFTGRVFFLLSRPHCYSWSARLLDFFYSFSRSIYEPRAKWKVSKFWLNWIPHCLGLLSIAKTPNEMQHIHPHLCLAERDFLRFEFMTTSSLVGQVGATWLLHHKSLSSIYASTELFSLYVLANVSATYWFACSLPSRMLYLYSCRLLSSMLNWLDSCHSCLCIY